MIAMGRAEIHHSDTCVRTGKKLKRIVLRTRNVTGRKYYNGEIFEASVFFPPQKVKFEDLDVFIPADYDKYLTNLYKDYMQLPPLEKRERHFIMKFELPND